MALSTFSGSGQVSREWLASSGELSHPLDDFDMPAVLCPGMGWAGGVSGAVRLFPVVRGISSCVTVRGPTGEGPCLPSPLTTWQKLKQLNQFPDFNNYLIFVLTRLKSEGMLPVPLHSGGTPLSPPCSPDPPPSAPR